MSRNLPNVFIALIRYPVKIIVSFIFSVFAVTCLLWGIWWSGALLLLISILLWTRFFKVGVCCLIITFATLPLTFNSISKRMDYLGSIIRAEGAEALSYPQRVSIYLGNISMAFVGFAILAPEVSIETLLMMDPSGKERHFNSDFAMSSDHISGLIFDYKNKVEKGQVPLQSSKIGLGASTWYPNSLPDILSEYRAWLALAGGDLYLEFEKRENTWIVNCKIVVPIKYPENAKIGGTIIPGVRLYIDESIFAALEDLGWLHPYYTHYNWSLEL